MNSINRGFTLIELMVTISILAIISVIAMPNFNSQISKIQFNHETKDVLALMAEARTQAIILKKDVTLNFNKSDNDETTTTHFFWDAKKAEIKSPSSIQFDMLGRLKTRPTNGCIAITHKSDNALKKVLTVSVLGGVDAIKENASC
ncbi:pilus assembly FimT family protein [Acinetobacter lanii]|uniref:Prepilin-type N-terminal cleavage/methylation domain-containing protein n=1 Tax=Acinetobacter lanii TaxID=2715163 RepID=A0A6G8S720_9GAMM|nr:prepilin-type N-terminal cleavage/methylation domain-containing protein [Acinetobacter lanii]QIO09979.1 prepilin-type N-terminal cleavage/methylation domain-containing protein [Acinetobacter lanii]